MLPRIDHVIEKVKLYNPSSDDKLLQRAYLFSAMAHEGQTRYSGEPYLVHPIAVADILAELKADDVALVAGLLHDVVEDNHSVSLSEIKKRFGDEVAHIVEGLTKIEEKLPGGERNEWATLRKVILAMVDDIRVILVKLADRLHNLRTMDALPQEKRPAKAKETLEIYAPIAYRLGLGKMKTELEDLSFRYGFPEDYARLTSALSAKRTYSEGFLEETRATLERILAELQVKGEVRGRTKHLYSIFQKLQRQAIAVEQVYDYMAFRILVEEVRDCYAVLGGIHTLWKPIPGRFKDFIAIPKDNHYRSLHTSVVGSNGQPFEIQIRTWQMHAEAENGIAAHWKYKEGRLTKEDEEATIAWLRQLDEIRQGSQDSAEFVQNLRVNLFPKEVYVFTPKGTVMSFPHGATPIDFAYAVHTEIGHKCTGAKINGKLVPLKTKLNSGDRVEIVTSPGGKPSRDWLDCVVTSRAISKIKGWLNQQEKLRAIEIGKASLDRECRRLKVHLKEAQEAGRVADLLKKLALADLDVLYAEIGYGKVAARTIARRLVADQETIPAALVESHMEPSKGAPIIVRGASDLLTTLAKCCKPIRGDEIVGFISRGKGLVVHRATCKNLQRLSYNPDRILEVAWEPVSENAPALHDVPVTLHTEDRSGMVASVTKVVSDHKAGIRHIEGVLTGGGEGRIKLVLAVRDKAHLSQILRQLSRLAGVIEVRRDIR